jgi:toxin ParE1/3/4
VSHAVIIRPEAEADLAEAYDWYEARRAGLGREFLEQVHIAVRSISENPLRHPLLYLNGRRVLLRRFPYKVFFIVENERVEVLGVVHVRRHPRTWERRL